MHTNVSASVAVVEYVMVCLCVARCKVATRPGQEQVSNIHP